MTVFRSTSEDFRVPLPCLLALPTDAWWGVEIHRRSAENGYVNLPGPYFLVEFYKNELETILF
jgi:hypothetical protein